MYIRMLTTLGCTIGTFRAGEIHDVAVRYGAEWVRKGLAEETTTPPPHIADILARLDEGAGRSVLFLPFVGEFGHEIMSHVRMVHFNRARRKVVCCRPGCEVLYPSAADFVTDWTDPIPDKQRVGTLRDRVIPWPAIVARYPKHHPFRAGGLTFDQEIFCFEPAKRITFHPKLRGLKADVVLGVRNRTFAPEKNWAHWQTVADAIAAAGYTFAVIGARDTAQDLRGQLVHSGDFDTDAAIELLQNCRLFVGTDSGAAHLAATVGAPMLVFREPRNGMRDFVPRMQTINPGKVDHLLDGKPWDHPSVVIERLLLQVAGFSLDENYKAQHGEDRWMAANWRKLGLPKRGTFVDVGAGDGVHISNTYWLERARGWRGLLIEPDPRSFRRLDQNRPDALIEHVAVGTTPGPATFHLMPCPEHSGLRRDDGQATTVQVETLTTLLDRQRIKRVDVLSIDTEGTEIDAWQSLDLSRWRPQLVLMEWSTVGLPSTREAIDARMTADGYKLAAVLGGNVLYVDERTDDEGRNQC